MEKYYYLVNLFYAYVGVICCLVIAIILNRTKATKYKESVDKYLCNVFRFFIIFTLVDAFWGIVGAQIAEHVPTIYLIATYGFHLCAAISSIFIAYYAVYFLKMHFSSKM